uniref:Uncharacterized protein n=1 Tax=Aegilops tauschii subsp. strangulata TaxID=200361 RepID=A0A453KG81_AEGTS
MAFTPTCSTNISNPNIEPIISKDISKRLFSRIYEPCISSLSRTMLKKNWRSSIICNSIFAMWNMLKRQKKAIICFNVRCARCTGSPAAGAAARRVRRRRRRAARRGGGRRRRGSRRKRRSGGGGGGSGRARRRHLLLGPPSSPVGSWEGGSGGSRAV